MLRAALCLALLLAPLAGRSEQAGEIDWRRRVLRAAGQGAPDLNAPSIAVARLAAERSALATAQRNALETLNAAPLEGGGTAGALLQKDSAARAKVQARLRAARATKTHYFSDGGVSLQLEVPLDDLPPELAEKLKPPPAAARPDAGAEPASDAGAK